MARLHTLPRARAAGRRDPLGAVGQVIRVIWSVPFDGFRDFVWADLKDGVLDLRGLPVALRALVWLGFALVLATLWALLVSDGWRGSFDLVPLPQGIPGRGRLVPSGLVPATLFLLAMAWSFVLAGAIQAHPAIRLATLAVYCLTIVGSTNSSIFSDPLALLSAGGAVLGLLVYFAVRWRVRARPVIDFSIILLLVASSSALLQSQSVQSWRTSGLPVMVTRLAFDLEGLTSLITPLLFLVGMGVAGFTAKLAGWTVAIAEVRLPRWSPYPLLVFVLAWDLWGAVPAAVERFQEAPRTESSSMLLALGVPLIVLLTWLVVMRVAARSGWSGDDRAGGEWSAGARSVGLLSVDEIAASVDRWAPRLIVAYSLPVLLAFLISVSALVFVVLGFMLGALYYVQAGLMGALRIRQGIDVTESS